MVRLLMVAAAVLLWAVLAADVAGVALQRPALWTAGAHLALPGVALGVAGGAGWLAPRLAPARGTGAGSRGRGPKLAFALALALFALARWVRGHPAVPPDPPVIGVEAIGAALLALALTRSRRSPRSAP